MLIILYLAVHMHICRLLESVISSFYVAAVSSQLFLSLLYTVVLVDRNKKVFVSLLSLWCVAVGSSIAYTVGVRGVEDAVLICQEIILGKWAGASFVAIFAYQATLLATILFAVRQKAATDRENLKTYERYERMARKGDSLHLAKPLTTRDHVSFL